MTQDISQQCNYFDNIEVIANVIKNGQDIETLLWNLCGEIMEIFHCDRVWLLFPCDPQSPSWQVPIERTVPEFPGASSKDTTIAMTPEVAEIFQTALSHDSPVVYGPGGLPLAENTKSFGVRSQLSMAIYPRLGKAWQFGIHQCRTERIWEEIEIKLFHIIGVMTGEALGNLLFSRNLQKTNEKLELRVEERTAKLEREVEERKAIEKSLRESEARMQLILEETDDGTWNWDLESGQVFYSDNWPLIFGYDPGDKNCDLEWWKKRVHPESLPIFEKALKDYQEGREKYFELEYQFRDKKGGWRWIWAKGIGAERANGAARLKMFGTHRDITKRKQAEEFLYKAKEDLELRVEEGSSSLKRKNIAFSELLEHMEVEKKQNSEKLNIRAQKILLPTLKKLQQSGTSLDNKYLSVLEKNIMELTSPYSSIMAKLTAILTPQELEVVNFVRDGLRSKEIAEIMKLSYKTVEVHRYKIRKKLGLSNKKVNLSSYLSNLQ